MKAKDSKDWLKGLLKHLRQVARVESKPSPKRPPLPQLPGSGKQVTQSNNLFMPKLSGKFNSILPDQEHSQDTKQLFGKVLVNLNHAHTAVRILLTKQAPTL